MSLAKIPVAVLVSWAFKRSMTPPNPAPSKDERIITAATSMFEGGWFTQEMTKYATALQWMAAMAEAVTILAWTNPTWPVSKAVLSTFVLKGGRPDDLRLTTLTSIGATMIVTGTLIRLMTFRYLGRFFRFEASIQRDHQLIVSGPYSIVRHPSYTGLLISHPGWFLWQLGRGSWVRESGLWDTAVGKVLVLGYGGLVILGTLYMVFGRMANEDAALKKQFGKTWEEWARNVPYLVLPGIY